MRAQVLLLVCLASCSHGGRMVDEDPPPIEQNLAPAPGNVAWTTLNLPCVPESSALVDYEGDRQPDVAVLCGGNAYLVGAGRKPTLFWQPPAHARLLGAAPLKNPLKDSLLVSVGNKLHILDNINAHGCVERVLDEAAASWVGSGDVDGDGLQDAVLASPDGRALGILGDGRVERSPRPAQAWVLVEVEGLPSILGFADEVFSVRFPKGNGPSVRSFGPSVLRPRWVYAKGTASEDGFLFSDGLHVYGASLGDPQLYLVPTCPAEMPPARLNLTSSALLCPGYAAVLDPGSATRFAVDPQASRLLSGDIDGDGSGDMVLLAGGKALFGPRP